MKLVRWSPLDDVSLIRDQINQIFEPLALHRTLSGEPARLMHTFPVEVTEKPDAYTVRVLAPGLTLDDLTLECTERELSITAEIPPRSVADNETVLMSQFQYGKFSKQLAFADAIDEAAVEAHYTHGVLSITLPKAEKSKRKLIEVKVT